MPPRRRSKRKAVVHPTRRRSSRAVAQDAKRDAVYGKDYGILPSD